MFTRQTKIEKRILEITKLISRDSTERGLSNRGVIREIVEEQMRAENEPLLKEKELLEIELQFILNRRENILWRTVWNVVVPIFVTVVTTLILSKTGWLPK